MRKQQQEKNTYTFQVTLETEQLLEQVVIITTDEEHPSNASLERLAHDAFDDHAWQDRDISPNIRVVGVKQIEDKKSGLSTDKCYYQLEFHPYERTESYVLLPGENWRRPVERRRALDVAPSRLIVREYHAQQKQCPVCHRITAALHPQGW